MKTKVFKFLLILLVIKLISSCSSDDNNSNNIIINESPGNLTYNGQSYDLVTLYIHDENIENNDPSDIGFSFANKTEAEINSGNQLTNIVNIYFDFTESNLQEVTYTNVLDYNISLNGTYNNGSFSEGNLILSNVDNNLEASSSTVTIINLTETTVNLTFSFTRIDGEIISGSYNGTYIIPEI